MNPDEWENESSMPPIIWVPLALSLAAIIIGLCIQAPPGAVLGPITP